YWCATGATPAGGQGPSYAGTSKKSFNTCWPKVLLGTPALAGSPVLLPEMLYIPQCVKEAVVSNATTTKVRVRGGARSQDSSGDSFPPALPSAVQTLTPFCVML